MMSDIEYNEHFSWDLELIVKLPLYVSDQKSLRPIGSTARALGLRRALDLCYRYKAL